MSTARARSLRFTILMALALCSAAVHAQDGPAAPSAAAAPVSQQSGATTIPLRLVVTISRYEGEKRLSSLPFTLWVNTNDGHTARLVSVQEVPIGVPAVPTNANFVSQFRSVEYKNVGTHIVARAEQVGGGLFRVTLDITDSSVVPSKVPTEPVRLETLTTSNLLLLTDGKHAEFIASSDKVTGEVTRISVTATVIK